jgi:hypothetical protein
MARATFVFTITVAVAAGASFFACSSSSGGSGAIVSGDAGDAASAAAEAYKKARMTMLNARCEVLARCGHINVVTAYGDVAQCKARSEAALVADAPGLSLSQATADACAAGLAALDCPSFDRTAFPAECFATGTLEAGAACDLDGQCASGLCYHANLASAACGVCTPPAPLGGDCSATDCAPQFVCVRNKCVAKVKVGGACNVTDKPCLSLLECVGGKCAAPVGVGQPCLGGTLPNCDFSQDLFCKADTTPATCVPLPFADLGQSCGTDTATSTLTLCRDSYCPGVNSLKSSKCAANVKGGQPCSADTTCESPYECLSGTCRVRDPKTCQ